MNFLTDSMGLGQSAHDCLERIEETLREIRASVENDPEEEFRRFQLAGVSDAAGQADLIFDTPLGIGIRLVSAACSGAAPGAATGCAVYVGSADNEANLVHVFDYGQRFSDVFADGEFVDSGGRIVFRFVGQGAGQRVTVNLKFMVVKSTATQIID